MTIIQKKEIWCAEWFISRNLQSLWWNVIRFEGVIYVKNELEKKSAALPVADGEYLPVMPELNLDMQSGEKIPLKNLSAMGVAFQPLTSAIQNIVSGGGGSGLYYVNTKGIQMFSTSEGFIGSLKTAAGTVGGGQARMTALPCDPTMLFMAAALMNIEKKLDTIQKMQEEILAFAEEKERAVLQGNFNALGDVMSNLKYNWNNETYKVNKHILIQQIKKEAEGSIVLYRDQIARGVAKRTAFHSDQDVKSILKKLQTQFQDYQLALYLYAYASFLEIMLLGNYAEGYLNSVEGRISEYSVQYRTLYSECYERMENYARSSIQAGVLGGLSAASKFVGETLSKVPALEKLQLDENLIDTSEKLDTHGRKRTVVALEGLVQSRSNVTLPFVDNIRNLNKLHNKSVAYLFDKDYLYIQEGQTE